jgi:hypothetical protein
MARGYSTVSGRSTRRLAVPLTKKLDVKVTLVQQRHADMFEESRKAEQIHTHLAALEQLANSYPENHSTRLLIESLGASRARSVIEGDISTVRGSLSSGCSGT